jgi:hypothetical protein
MFALPGCFFTSGILSRPWSPLASLPPDVDVPLPVLLGDTPAVSWLAFWELAIGE